VSRSEGSVHHSWFILTRRALATGVALLFVFATAAVGAGSTAVAAPTPDPNYPIEFFKPGERLQLPLLMARYRHTILTEQDKTDHPDDYVGWGRNYADGFWQTQVAGHTIDWYLTAPVVSKWEANTKIAPVDLWQFDENTGMWRLVDTSGNQLLGPDGKPVAWDKSSQPTLRLDVSAEPDLAADLAAARAHAEVLMRFIMTRKLAPSLGADIPGTVIEVGSEMMFCSGPPNCVNNLQRKFFPNPNFRRGVILTNLPSKATLNKLAYPTGPYKNKVSKEQKEKARQDLKDKQYSDAVVESEVREWVAKGIPVGTNTSAVMGGSNFGAGTGNSAAQGPAAKVSAQGSDPGGIDFTSLQLRYVSEKPGGTFQYAYSASPAGPGSSPNAAQAQLAMAQMADAFYVWLNLPTSTFWVNLNPSEPDRIIDAKLATTDVGRILLNADLRMKQMAAQLTNPDTATGLQFWGTPNPDNLTECTVTRQWIVPKPATVHEGNGGLYIIDAPLQVKAEATMFNGTQGDPSCPSPSARMEQVFEQLILPKVEDTVNHAPEFAELRRVYLARVAAEWYRQRHAGTLTSMIDSGNVRQWPALQSWSPTDVFNAYVKSYKNHEYNVTKTVDRGNYRYTFTYSDGGVDFGDVPMSKVPDQQFSQQYADLSKAVDQSFQAQASDGHSQVWLGGTTALKPAPLNYLVGEDASGDGGPPPDWALSPAPTGGGSVVVWIVLAILLFITVAAALVTVVMVSSSRRRLRQNR
jgi:hypothetical protein